MNRGTFTFITAIQDETHRFANAYRKQQMKQKSYSSTLTEIPGIGPKTAKALMAQFKSVGAVKEATPDQLENTPGVGKQTAQIIAARYQLSRKGELFAFRCNECAELKKTRLMHLPVTALPVKRQTPADRSLPGFAILK